MRVEGDEVIFSSGKRLYANAGIIGLSERLDVTEGYDGGFCYYDDKLTEDERHELADYMIDLWNKYKG
jgi:hypothetical protein